MHQMEHEPMQTLHIYLEQEQPPRPSLLPIILSLCALSILIAIGVLSPNQQPEQRASLRVPAVLSALRTFTAVAPVTPTGIKTYPATIAHGVLTITNGSVISQTLPSGLIFISCSGISVVTDQAVFVPAGSANGYGVAYVSTHALTSGRAGNIPALAVDTVEGSSVYVRNLAAFQGGRDAYSVKVVTAQDKQNAFLQARAILLSKSSGLHYPCTEHNSGGSTNIVVTWHCQFVSYHIPAFYHVTGVKITGKNLLLAVWFVARPVHIWVK
jgi:hypothetical protein